MNQFLEFLITYWREILQVIILLASFVIWICRKKPVKVVDTLKETILRLLPGCINAAEMQSGLTGKDKLNFCISLVQGSLKEMGIGDDIISTYLPFICNQVEVILSTPQKKKER